MFIYLFCFMILQTTFAQVKESCTDDPPSSAYTCQQQKDWGKCNFDWMVQGNFCAETCGRCTATDIDTTCTDVQPDTTYTCQQQKDWGKCSAPWMKFRNYCAKTCEFCDQGNVDDFKCGFCIFGVCETTRCADSDCNARQSNIQGDLVMLDVNSRFFNVGPNKPPRVTNPAECCDQCRQTSGCNAWVFCSNKNGCGSGCQKYIDSLNLDLPKDYDNPLKSKLFFGQFGPRCSEEKWPWLMCSLKTVSDVNNPQEASAEDGWVSGVLQ